jgi:hypothetical protein
MLLLLFISSCLANEFITFAINDDRRVLPNTTIICYEFSECYSIYKINQDNLNAYMMVFAPINSNCELHNKYYSNEYFYPVLLDLNKKEILGTDCLLRNFFSIAINYLCYGYLTFENASWMALYL